jgi:hypothetical protein
MLSLINLQEYLRFKARQHHEVVSAPPFTLFFHTTDGSSDANYALPDESKSSNLQDSLRRLQTIFTERAQSPIFSSLKKSFRISCLFSALLDGRRSNDHRS